jgi:hypothetical protein
MTATTQSAGDNTSKLATDAFVIANRWAGTSTYTSSSLCGTTGGFTANSGDSATLFLFNCTATYTITLPAIQPSTTFYMGVQAESGGSVQPVIALASGATWFGTSTAPTLGVGQTLWIFADTQTAGNYVGYIVNASSVADTTVAVPAATFNANSCTAGANSPLTMTGLTTTMTVTFTANSDTHATTGWGAPAAGVLYITNYPSAANTVTFYVCNNTASNITTSASQTFNVSAR